MAAHAGNLRVSGVGMTELTSAIDYIDWIQNLKLLQLRDSWKRTHTSLRKISPRP